MPRPSAILLVLTASFYLQACAFAPGQHLDAAHLANEGAVEHLHIEVVPITPKLLAIQEAERTIERLAGELVEYQPEPYRIGPGDVLQVTVWDYPEITSPSGQQPSLHANGRVVRPDGTLFYPYTGSIKAAGLTVEELRAALAERLSRVIASPQVDVTVIGYASRKVVVTGAFENQGAQPITTAPLSLLEAVGKAGIRTAEADLSGLRLKRGGKEYRLDLDALNRGGANLDRVYLRDGDQIHLSSNEHRRVYVLGEVNRVGTLPFRTRTLTLANVLGTMGGLRQETSSGRAVYVIRGAQDLSDSTATVFQLDAKSPTAFVLAEHFHIEPKDVIYVGAASITRWNRFISLLFPSTGLINTAIDLKDELDSN